MKTEAVVPILERGFHFIIVLWGERFRDYFLEYCLPSLLAPGNLPALRTRNASKFLIATRPDDWERMRSTAIFRLMEQYVTPVFLEIPPCPPGRSGCEHMGLGHKLACEHAFRDKAYAMVLTPDAMVSDGSIARLQELARDGFKLVQVAALRFGEEPFLANLRSVGAIPDRSRRDAGEPLAIGARDMAWAAVNGLHRETLGYEWDGTYLVTNPAAAWWRVPGEDAMVIHSISWSPMLIDYAAVAAHDTSTFDNWTFDGDYIHRNFDRRAATYVVQDSDEVFLASWGPMAEGATGHRSWNLLKVRTLRDLVHGAQIRRLFNSHFSDPMKRELFFKPVRWHAKPLNGKWEEVERRSIETLQTYLGADADASFSLSVRQVGLKLLSRVWLGLFDPFWELWVYRRAAARRLSQILKGDRLALHRALWHVRRALHHSMDRAFNEAPPRPPA